MGEQGLCSQAARDKQLRVSLLMNRTPQQISRGGQAPPALVMSKASSRADIPMYQIRDVTLRGRGSQVVRQRSAKPLFVGSIPTRASNL